MASVKINVIAYLVLLLSVLSTPAIALPPISQMPTTASVSKHPPPHPSNSTRSTHLLSARSEIKELTGKILEDHWCFSKADVHGYSDHDIKKLAHTYCKVSTDEGILDANDRDRRHAIYYNGRYGNAVEIAVMEVQFCDPGTKLDYGYSCWSLVYGAWKQCYHNDGRGGAVDQKCLRYSVRPYWARDDEFDPADHWTGNWLDDWIIDGFNFDGMLAGDFEGIFDAAG